MSSLATALTTPLDAALAVGAVGGAVASPYWSAPANPAAELAGTYTVNPSVWCYGWCNQLTCRAVWSPGVNHGEARRALALQSREP